MLLVSLPSEGWASTSFNICRQYNQEWLSTSGQRWPGCLMGACSCNCGGGGTRLRASHCCRCVCTYSLLMHRQPLLYEHHPGMAKTVLWPHCTFLNNHVVSSSWSPSSCHYSLGFIFTNHFYIGCICAEVSACCLSPAWDKERRHCELQYSGSST